MADMKWFKVNPDIFNDEKIRIIDTMPDNDGVIVVWFKMLALAARSTSDGVLMFDEGIPYDSKTLAAIFNRKDTLVQLSLQIFEKYRMIEIFEDGSIYILNWEKYQNIDYMMKIREQNRLRKAKQRAKVQIELNSKKDSHVNKRDMSRDVTPQKENKKENKKKEKESNKEPIGSLSADTDSKIDFLMISNYWNSHSGLKEITGITQRRRNFIILRVKQAEELGKNGVDAIFKVIDNCRHSPFLKGQNDRNWIATFDWIFGKPDNFIKVLEGNYIKNNISKDNNNLKSRADHLERKFGSEK